MIFSKAYHPPAGFQTTSLCCFPTEAAYSVTDWKAVMESRDSLRIWSQSGWPEDTFSIKQNRDDLLLHVQDNRDHAAYGYMLFDPDRVFCHGSVYVNPPDSLKEDYTLLSGESSLLNIFQARVEFWIRDAPESNSLDIGCHLLNWIRKDWGIPACFTAREGMADRFQLYKRLDLKECIVLKNNDSGNTLHLFPLNIA